MAALATFLPPLLLEAQGVPNPIAESYIVRSANEFCRRSLVWSAVGPDVTFIDSTRDYAIILPAGASLADVVDVWIGTRKLRGADLGLIASELAEWQSAEGAPSYFTVSARSPATLSFYPLPVDLPTGTAFTPRYAYAPSLTATTLPDFLAADFLHDIVAGALSYLLAMSKQPWADPALAVRKQAAFDKAIDNARIEAMHGQTVGVTTAKPRSFR